MNLLEFFQEYPDEQSCRTKFREMREKAGVICKKCYNTTHYWKRDKECFECKKCHFRTTLRSGTVMHASKLSFQDWFIAMHLLTSTKKSFSAKEMQRQLGKKRYEPVWAMLHKLRAVMGLRDDKYKIEGKAELDDAFFTVVFQTSDTEDKTHDKDKPRGRGTRKAAVMVMTSYDDNIPENKRHKGKRPKSKSGYLKMKIINSFQMKEANRLVKENISEEAILKTDSSTSYNGLAAIVKEHDKQVVKPEDAGKILPWVHIAIANAKRLLLDIHHSVDADFLNNYLNEFCWKFNRRKFGNQLFDRLLISSISYRWDDLR